MATIKFFKHYGNWTGGILGRFEHGDVTESSPGIFKLTVPNDYDDPPELAGFTVTYKAKSSFTYDGGDPIDGAVKTIEVRDQGGDLVMSITGIKGINLGEIYRYIVQQSGGPEARSNQIMELALRGNDTYTGSDQDDEFSLNISAGNDKINGRGGHDWIAPGAGNDTVDGGDPNGNELSYDTTRWTETAFQGATIDLIKHTVEDPWGGHDTFKNFNAFKGSHFADTFIGGTASDPGEYAAWVGGGGRDSFILKHDMNVWVRYENDDRDGGTRGVKVDLGKVKNDSTGDVKGTIVDGYGHKDSTTNIRKVSGTDHNDTFIGSRLNDHFGGDRGVDSYNGGNKGIDFVHFDGRFNGSVDINLGLNAVIDDGYGNAETLVSIEGVRGSFVDDVITGSGADNVLIGMGGDDTITGGAGKDKFVYAAYNNGEYDEFGDHILDFKSGKDKFVFDRWFVSDLDEEVRFHNGASATAANGNSEFYFNAADHTLYLDTNGKGSGHVIAVAILDNSVTSLKASDFQIIDGYSEII